MGHALRQRIASAAFVVRLRAWWSGGIVREVVGGDKIGNGRNEKDIARCFSFRPFAGIHGQANGRGERRFEPSV